MKSETASITCSVGQAEQAAQPGYILRADVANSHVLGPSNSQCQCLILRVAGGGDKIPVKKMGKSGRISSFSVFL